MQSENLTPKNDKKRPGDTIQTVRHERDVEDTSLFPFTLVIFRILNCATIGSFLGDNGYCATIGHLCYILFVLYHDYCFYGKAINLIIMSTMMALFKHTKCELMYCTHVLRLWTWKFLFIYENIIMYNNIMFMYCCKMYIYALLIN